jgi:transcriptional regulator with XRE-family HTH domain
MTKQKLHSGTFQLQKKLGPMTLGSFLKSWRLSLDLTQVEFSQILNLSSANLCDIEKGRQLVSIKKAAQIANMIGYSEVILIELALNDQLAAEGFKMRVKTEVA